MTPILQPRRLRLAAAALLLATPLLLTACRSSQRMAYAIDAPRDEEMEITNKTESTIQPDDLLYIYVYSQTPESSIPFNQETNRGRRRGQADGYRVSSTGKITFPILGPIEVAGMTLAELAKSIETRLKVGNYVNDPIVTVRLLNFHVTVIGEVKRPRQVQSENGRLTILEALALCGDITIDGMRNNVVVVRTNQDETIVDTLDLTRKEMLDSPFYYLQQNDIIFVEPTEKKRRRAYRNEDWPRYMTTGLNALRIAYRTIYHLRRVQNSN